MGIISEMGQVRTHKVLLLILLVSCLFLLSCASGKDSPRGFSLPEGNAEEGKFTFVALQCNACHATVDVEQLTTAEVDGISVYLGGEVHSVKTYAALVTAIINPSHRLASGYPIDAVAINGESRMLNYNDVMTVEQLIDLVSYLQPQYKIRLPAVTKYPDYYLHH